MDAVDDARATKAVTEGASRSDETNDDYDPYEHRDEEGKPLTSTCMAWSNLVKSSIGTGVFAMPQAFSFVGLVNGIVGTIFLGLVLVRTFHMLLSAHYETCKLQRRPTLTYSEVVYVAVKTGPEKMQRHASRARCCMDAMLVTCFVGISAVYVVFIAGILRAVADPEKSLDPAIYPAMLFPFAVAINLIKNLRYFAPLSMIGNVIMILAVCAGIYGALDGGEMDGDHVMFADTYSEYPRFIGAVFFGLGSPGLILSIENSMRNPARMSGACGVLNLGTIPVTVLHVLVGVAGYLRWTTDARANFLTNLPANWISTTALVMQAISIYVSYGLQCYMPICILRDEYVLPAIAEREKCWKSSLGWDLLIRLGVSLLTCALAATVPELGLFIGLVGALCISSLGVLIPVMLNLLVHHDDLGRYRWRLCVGILLLVLGFVAIVLVVGTTIYLIARFFLDENANPEERSSDRPPD